jgi:hypothetical protein
VVVLLLDMIWCRSRGVPFLQQQGTMAAGPILGKHDKEKCRGRGRWSLSALVAHRKC